MTRLVTRGPIGDPPGDKRGMVTRGPIGDSPGDRSGMVTLQAAETAVVLLQQLGVVGTAA